MKLTKKQQTMYEQIKTALDYAHANSDFLLIPDNNYSLLSSVHGIYINATGIYLQGLDWQYKAKTDRIEASDLYKLYRTLQIAIKHCDIITNHN